jgi:hypothetical protein
MNNCTLQMMQEKNRLIKDQGKQLEKYWEVIKLSCDYRQNTPEGFRCGKDTRYVCNTPENCPLLNNE